jgi:hypothetical protein
MLAHSHAQVWNAAEPARSLGKRQVKAPKLYIRDSGIFHALHGLASEKEILSHPKAGASWEGYVLEEILQVVPNEGAFFWATHTGAELDHLTVIYPGDRAYPLGSLHAVGSPQDADYAV